LGIAPLLGDEAYIRECFALNCEALSYRFLPLLSLSFFGELLSLAFYPKFDLIAKMLCLWYDSKFFRFSLASWEVL